MKFYLLDKILELAEKLHFRLFKYKLSLDMKTFLGNMGYAGLSSVITALLLGVLQIVAVRALGPTEYGKVTLVFTVANFMPYFMFMGLQAGLSKYLAEKNPENQKGMIVTTSLSGIFFFTAITVVLAYAARNYVPGVIGFSLSIYGIGVIYSVVTVFKTATECVLRGLLKFKTQAKLDIVYTSVAFVAFFLLYISPLKTSYITYIASFAVGLLTYAFTVLFKNRHYIKWHFFDINTFKTLLSYGVYSVIASFALFILWGSDRFFINKYLDIKSVGVYSVYYGTSLIVLGRFSSIFIKVLFPTASGMSDKLEMNKKLGKLMLFGILPLFILNFGMMSLMLLIYGNQYPFNPIWIGLFSLNAILYTYINSRGTLLVSQGMRGNAFYSFWSSFMAVLAFFLYLLMIPSFGLTGAILAVIVVSFVFFTGLSYYTKNLFEKEKNAEA